MVVMVLPSAISTVVIHERTATPSKWIVQAPHTPCPQPYLVPVRPATSRRYQSSGVPGSPSKERLSPFTVRVAILLLPILRRREPPTASETLRTFLFVTFRGCSGCEER